MANTGKPVKVAPADAEAKNLWSELGCLASQIQPKGPPSPLNRVSHRWRRGELMAAFPRTQVQRAQLAYQLLVAGRDS